MDESERVSKLPIMSATEARSGWSKLLATADQAGGVLVTRYGEPHVVLMPAGRYRTLVERAVGGAERLARARGQTSGATADSDEEEGWSWGRMTGQVTMHGDLIAPIDEAWDADQEPDPEGEG